MTLRGSLNNAVEGQDVQTLPGGGTGKPRWARELRAEEHREPSPPPSAQPILVTTRPRSLLPVAEIAHRLTAHREFLTDEESTELLRRLVCVLPDGPLVDGREVFPNRPGCNER